MIKPTSTRRSFLRGAISFAAAALAMPTALTDLDAETPEGCACEFGLPCTKGPWFNHYSHKPLGTDGLKLMRKLVRESGPFLITTAFRSTGKTSTAAVRLLAKGLK